MHKNQMIRILIIFCFSIIPSLAFCNESLIDYSFEKHFELSNKRKAKAVLKVDGTNWQNPIKINLSIYDSKSVIYSYQSDFLFPEEEYFEPDYFDNCSEYKDCKKQYYLSLLDNIIVSTKNRRYIRNDHIELLNIGLKYQLPSEKHSIIKSFISYLLSAEYVQLFIPVSIYKCREILVFNNDLNKFLNVSIE